MVLKINEIIAWGHTEAIYIHYLHNYDVIVILIDHIPPKNGGEMCGAWTRGNKTFYILNSAETKIQIVLSIEIAQIYIV